MVLPVQDGRIEGHVLISSWESTKITTSYWTAINRTLESTKKKKRCPTCKNKKSQWDGRNGTIMIKSNPTPTGSVTHELENNNTKELLLLLWKFGTPHQASQPGDLTKGLGIPKESDLKGQWDLIIRLPLDRGKQRLQSWRAQTKP